MMENLKAARKDHKSHQNLNKPLIISRFHRKTTKHHCALHSDNQLEQSSMKTHGKQFFFFSIENILVHYEQLYQGTSCLGITHTGSATTKGRKTK
jgi:hypothetical protein